MNNYNYSRDDARENKLFDDFGCDEIDNVKHQTPMFSNSKLRLYEYTKQDSYNENYKQDHKMCKEIKVISWETLDNAVTREKEQTKLDFNCIYGSASETDLIYKAMEDDKAILNHPVVVTFVALKSLKMKWFRLCEAALWLLYLTISFSFHFYYNKCLFSTKFNEEEVKTRSYEPPSYCNDADDESGRIYALWFAFIAMTPFFLCCEIFRMTESLVNFFSNFQSYCCLLLTFSSVICCPYYKSHWQNIFSVMSMIACGIILMMILGTLL